MGFLAKKHKGMIFCSIGKLAMVSFVSMIGFALVDSVWALYLKELLLHDSYVGFFSSFLSLISFFSFFLIIPLLQKTNKSKLYLFAVTLTFISYLFFSFSKNLYFFVSLAIIVTILHSIRITSFGIITKDKSSEKKLSRNEGIIYSFVNLAWTIGPLIAGLLLKVYGISMVFISASFFIFLSILLFKMFSIKDKNTTKKSTNHLVKNFKEFFKQRERTLAYILGGGVNFWWSLIYLFMPLYILNQGIGVQWIGYFLFAITLPLITCSYFFSKLAGKTGFKKIFKIGFFIPFVAALLSFIFPNVYLVMLFLTLASFGLAMIEAPTEAYFFDLLKGKQDLKFYGPYNTTIDLNHFIGRLLSAVLLLFMPFKFVFLFFSISMLVFVFVSSKIKNVVESKKDGKKNNYH